MIEFIGGFVLGASISALVTIYILHRPYDELESTISPVSLDYWQVPSAQVEYRAADIVPYDIAPESKRAELARKLAERAKST